MHAARGSEAARGGLRDARGGLIETGEEAAFDDYNEFSLISLFFLLPVLIFCRNYKGAPLIKRNNVNASNFLNAALFLFFIFWNEVKLLKRKNKNK